MHTVTFYSYKGGVGRTLAVANVAKYLARIGMKVFVLDFDLEAPGIHYKFASEHDTALKVERGLVDILSAFATARRLPEPLTDYVIEVASPPLAPGTIHILPAGSAPSPAYWKSLSKVDWHALFYAEEAEGIPVFLELKAFIEDTYAPDLVLIDARTGITEMGGVATTVLSDQVVCMMLPTREHLDGSRQVMHAIQTAPRIEGAAKINLLAVLSRLPTKNGIEEAAEIERVKQFLNLPIDDLGSSLHIEDLPVLHRDAALEEREEILVGGSRSLDDSLLLQDYVRLFVKLVPPRVIEKTVGRVIEDIQKRLIHSPDDAEQALEALAKEYLHPEVYRALLGVYRLRRSPTSQKINAAHTLWSITHDASDSLLWDAIKDYGKSPSEKFGVDHLKSIEAIWQAHHPEDSRLAMPLSFDYEAAGLLSQSISVLKTNASTNVASVYAVAKLIHLLCKSEDHSHADYVIMRYKERMAQIPEFIEAWVESALTKRLPEHLEAVLADTHFSLTVVAEKVPALGARLNLFLTFDKDAAKAFLAGARFTAWRPMSGYRGKVMPRSDLAQLGALARSLGEQESFNERLGKEFPALSVAMIKQIDGMALMPHDDDDIPF